MHNKQVKYETKPENIVIGKIKRYPVFSASKGSTRITPPIMPLTRPMTVIKLLIGISRIKGLFLIIIQNLNKK